MYHRIMHLRTSILCAALSFAPAFAQLPSLVQANPAPGCSLNAVNSGNPSNYVKLQCFSFPALGTLGNLGRNTMRGPGLEDFDFSLFKNHNLLRDKLKSFGLAMFVLRHGPSRVSDAFWLAQRGSRRLAFPL